MYFADYVPQSHKDAKQCWKYISERKEDFHRSYSFVKTAFCIVLSEDGSLVLGIFNKQTS